MGLAYPLLRDVDSQHVDAWGIRNEEYGPGTFAYGIPHPGVVLVSPNGEILAKWGGWLPISSRLENRPTGNSQYFGCWPITAKGVGL